MTKKLFAGLLLVFLLAQPSHAEAEPYIQWDKVEDYVLSVEYEWLEDSGRVWFLQWWMGIETDGVYGSITHKQHRQWAMERSIPVRLYSTVSPDATFKPEVERWRPIVQEAILANGGPLSDTARFLSIINCESGGDPDAYNRASLASGLMQHLQNYWGNRARLAGFPDSSPFDPVANIYTSAWLIYRATGGGWQHWVCT